MAKSLGSPALVFSVWLVDGRDGRVRRALLRRAGGALSGSGRRLRLPARSLRRGAGLPLRLDGARRDGPRHHRRARRGPRPVRGLRLRPLALRREDRRHRLDPPARGGERLRPRIRRAADALAHRAQARPAPLRPRVGLRLPARRLVELRALRRAARRLGAARRGARRRAGRGLLLVRRLVGLVASSRAKCTTPRATCRARSPTACWS